MAEGNMLRNSFTLSVPADAHWKPHSWRMTLLDILSYKANTLSLKTPDTSPNSIPQAPSNRPWRSRWFMADGAMWTNQEIRQENPTPSSICQEMQLFGF